MSSIRVVDVNNEEAPQEVEVKPAIEEAKEEVAPAVEEAQPDIKNEVVEQTKEEPTAQPKAEPKAEAKAEAKVKAQDAKLQVKAQDRLITCPKCNKTMKTKSYRYNHEKICQGNLTDRPVKPKAKPKPKPEPIEEPIIEPHEVMSEQRIQREQHEVMSEQRIPKPQQQKLPPANPLMSHYQLLQQEYMKQKQERFNNLFQGMVSGSRKKR